MLKTYVFLSGIFLAGSVYAACRVCSADFSCVQLAKENDCQDRSCMLHETNCGNYSHEVAQLPAWKEVIAQPVLESKGNPILKSTTPVEICKPVAPGPKLNPLSIQQISEIAEGNWLLLQALDRFSKRMAKGIPNMYNQAFALAQTEEQKQAVLQGKEIAFPADHEQGYNGFMASTVWADDPAHPFPENGKKLRIALHLWKIDREKNVPSHGMKAYLVYKKNEKNGEWEYKGIRPHYEMPKPDPKSFANLAGNPFLQNYIYSLGR